MSDQKEELFTFGEFREFMFNRILPVEDIEDSNGEPLTKSLPYWRKNELLPFVPKGSHIKLSCAQLIWIRILDTLRSLSYPIEKTKKVCDYFFRDAYNDDLPEKNLRFNHNSLKKCEAAGTLTENERYTLEFLRDTLEDKVLLRILKLDISYLTNLVTNCILSREEMGILIFADGRVGEWKGDFLTTHAKYKVNKTEPHIYLSIPFYLKEFIQSEQLSTIVLPQLLNADEKMVLREMKDRNVKEINISVDGKKIKIQSTKQGVISGEQALEVKRLLGIANYEEITINTLDEKTFRFKRTRRKK